jgi:hypothetical protein
MIKQRSAAEFIEAAAYSFGRLVTSTGVVDSPNTRELSNRILG